MKYLIYILLCVFCFSCARQEKGMESSEDMAVEESMEASESEDILEYKEDAPMNSNADLDNSESSPFESNIFIKQQLQETLNLIVLNNKLDINQELKTELEESIAQKAQHYVVNQSLDILKVESITVLEQKTENNKQKVNISFKALDKNRNLLHGQAKAVVTMNSVNIDGQDYTDYQVYFKEIVVE